MEQVDDHLIAVTKIETVINTITQHASSNNNAASSVADNGVGGHSSEPPPKETSKKNNNNKKFKFKFLDITNIHHLKKSEIYDYIVQLHGRLKRVNRKLKKYKEKLRQKRRSLQKMPTPSPPPADPPLAIKKEHVENEVQIDGVRPEIEAAAATGEDPAKETRPISPQAFIDEIKQAAENAQNQMGFVYEPTSGLYYDCKTGYYYNAEHGLYYDGNTGCYYKYDQANDTFEFHSQVYAEDTDAIKNEDDPASAAATATFSKKVFTSSYLPYSEYTNNTTNRIESLMHRFAQIDIRSQWHHSNALDVATRYPPSLRIVVQESTLPKLRVGELFIITYKGGTLGREGAHDVIIPDINVSKFHLKFRYSVARAGYECIDLGSRNGTVLDGRRMSMAKQESRPLPVIHGSNMQLSQTKLLFHIHDGHATCDDCEPGLLLRAGVSAAGGNDAAGGGGDAPSLTHKQELKMIKKRYGLADEKYLIQQSTKNDRAAQRRKEVGSSDKSEKTQVASLDANIPTENKGFKMLSKLGWSQGQKLGKNDAGLLEPVALVSNTGTKGLGCSDLMAGPAAATPQFGMKTAKKTEQLRITQERYNRPEAPTDIFIGDSE